MHPIHFETANGTLRGTSDGVEDLPVRFGAYTTGERFVESCWRLGWRERLRVLRRGRIYLIALGRSHPPVLIQTQAERKETK